MNIKYIKNIKSATLIELLVTLGIMVIILTLITNIFTQIIRINLIVKERIYVRESTANILSLLRKDIRNADSAYVVGCTERVSDSSCIGTTLIVVQQSKKYQWETYQGVNDQGTTLPYYYIKKTDLDTNAILYNSPNTVLLKANNIFTVLLDQNSLSTEVVDTVSAVFEISLIGQSYTETADEPPAVENVIKQTIVATRNYKL